LIVIPKEAFRLLSGEIKYHTKLSDGGDTMERGFCPDCGARLTIYEPHRPKLFFIHAASLDDPGVYDPSMNIFTASSYAWDVMNSDLETHPRMPPVPDGFGC